MFGRNDVTCINEMLKAIESHSENLKELEISSDFAFEIHSKNFECFGNLQKLWLGGEKLKIDLEAVTKYCTKLTYVKLIGK